MASLLLVSLSTYTRRSTDDLWEVISHDPTFYAIHLGDRGQLETASRARGMQIVRQRIAQALRHCSTGSGIGTMGVEPQTGRTVEPDATEALARARLELEHLEQGRLARTRRPDDREHVASFHPPGDVTQDTLRLEL